LWRGLKPGWLTSWSTKKPGRLTSWSTKKPGRLTSWSTPLSYLFRYRKASGNETPGLPLNDEDVVFPEG
ncbi:MAG TPA: hypothetical protein PLK65_02505, partial [Candidatus Cloacimonas sp.]|nr:hypothetical protein [Candidatus Cloacimonas sp.]